MPTLSARAPTPRPDRLTAAQQRAVVGSILAAHVVAGWALLQVKEVREAVAQASPLFVDLLRPATPPPVPPAPPPPPVPRKPPPPAAVIAVPLAPSPAPAPFVVPEPEPEPALPPMVVQAPPAPLAPPAPPAPPRFLPPSAVQYLEPPVLEYPRASRRLRESGRVVVRVFIDDAGRPRGVEVARSSGFARLDEAAVAAVSKARFKPYTENGQPVAGWAQVPAQFDLEN